MQLKWNQLLRRLQSIKSISCRGFSSPIKHVCWQCVVPHPFQPVYPQGYDIAAIPCFLCALCLARHLEPMSRAGLAKCQTAFFKKTLAQPHCPKQTKKRNNNIGSMNYNYLKHKKSWIAALMCVAAFIQFSEAASFLCPLLRCAYSPTWLDESLHLLITLNGWLVQTKVGNVFYEALYSSVLL